MIRTMSPIFDICLAFAGYRPPSAEAWPKPELLQRVRDAGFQALWLKHNATYQGGGPHPPHRLVRGKELVALVDLIEAGKAMSPPMPVGMYCSMYYAFDRGWTPRQYLDHIANLNSVLQCSWNVDGLVYRWKDKIIGDHTTSVLFMSGLREIIGPDVPILLHDTGWNGYPVDDPRCNFLPHDAVARSFADVTIDGENARYPVGSYLHQAYRQNQLLATPNIPWISLCHDGDHRWLGEQRASCVGFVGIKSDGTYNDGLTTEVQRIRLYRPTQ